MADEDVPPPLEDMTETLEQARKLKALKLASQGQSASAGSKTGSRAPISVTQDSTQKNSPPATQSSPQSNTTPTTPKTENVCPAPSQKGGAGDFGGMKKGFLFGGGAKSTSVSGSQKTKAEKTAKTENAERGVNGQAESIPFIKPKEEKESGLKLDEVQKAMESTKGFLQDKDWVTEDLLEKVQKNETLSKRMEDPRFMQAVTEFQANPKAAMAKYQSNPEMQLFLKEFCGILGEHFTTLAEKQDNQNPTQTKNPSMRPSGPKITELTDEDVTMASQTQTTSVPVDPQVQQILSDPANQEILMDPKVQMLIESLRNNPEKAQRMLREGDSSFRQKVDRLISLGLLKFQA